MNTLKLKKNLPSGTIILSRPDKRNAITREMIADLLQAFDDFHGEKNVRAIILTGAGTAFCAGMDLAEMQATAQEPDAMQRWHDDSIAYRELLERMLQYP